MTIQAQQQANDPQLQSVRRGMMASTASIALAQKNISIRFIPLPSDEAAAFKRLVTLKEGETLAFEQAASLRMRTETDLIFGTTVIKTENQAPNYPGIYSIWLKKGRDGWKLVFNSQGDIWGTQHDAARDVAEVPLAMRKIEKAENKLIIELKKEGESAGLLRLAWGTQEWTAKFTIPAKP